MHYDKNERHVYVIDGSKCRTQTKLFEELSSAMKFPSYFGMNWNAVIDCLRDIMDAAEKDVIVIINNSDDVLIEEVENLNVFKESFDYAEQNKRKFIVIYF